MADEVLSFERNGNAGSSPARITSKIKEFSA
jgi:hypothetical protein